MDADPLHIEPDELEPLIYEPTPWYRDPGSVALVFLACIAVGAVGGVLLSRAF